MTYPATAATPRDNELKELLTTPTSPVLIGDRIAYRNGPDINVWSGHGADEKLPGYGHPQIEMLAAGDQLICYNRSALNIFKFSTDGSTAAQIRIRRDYEIDIASADESFSNEECPIEFSPILRVRALVSNPTMVIISLQSAFGLWDTRSFELVHWWARPACAGDGFDEMPAECVSDDALPGDMVIIYHSYDSDYNDLPTKMYNLRTGDSVRPPRPFSFGCAEVVAPLANPLGVLFHGARGPIVWDQTLKKVLTVPSRCVKKSSERLLSHCAYSPSANAGIRLSHCAYLPSANAGIRLVESEEKQHNNTVRKCAKWLQRFAPVMHPYSTRSALSSTLDIERLVVTTPPGFTVYG
jgi:hypothetical protein